MKPNFSNSNFNFKTINYEKWMLVFTAASLVFAACNNEKTEGGDAVEWCTSGPGAVGRDDSHVVVATRHLARPARSTPPITAGTR